MEGIFVRRQNRFVIRAKIENKSHDVFMANPGRMKELLIPGVKTKVVPVDKPSRKTRFDLALVQSGKAWVSLNSHLANDLFEEGLQKKRLPQFASSKFIRREIPVGRSRLDFLLEKKRRKYFIEVKSVTLVKGEIAMFPDAPTNRGARHIRELINLKKEGHEAGIVFVIQREDGKSFTTNRETDPDFADALVKGHKAGIDIFAYRCKVSPKRVEIEKEVKVFL